MNSPIQEIGKAAKKCASTLPFMYDRTTKMKRSAVVYSIRAKSKPTSLIPVDAIFREDWVAIVIGNDI